MRRWRGWLWLVLVVLCPLQGWALQYQLVDLGLGTVGGIDPQGDTAVGTSLGPMPQAYILYPTPQPLGFLPGGLMSSATATRAGRTVGTCGVGLFSLFTHSCVFTTTEGLVDLGTLGADTLFSAATSVNASGLLLGYGEAVSGGPLQMLVWEAGVPRLVPVRGASAAFGLGVNDAAYLVGGARFGDGLLHAVLVTLGGGVFDLGALSLALAINNAEGAVLVADQTPSGARAGLWRSDGKHVLPPLAGDDASLPGGLNDLGVAVGTSRREGAELPLTVTRAVLWDTQDTPVELLPLVVNGEGWRLEEARGVNNAGLILGQGRLGTERHGFVLVPLPEAPPAPAGPTKATPRQERLRRK